MEGGRQYCPKEGKHGTPFVLHFTHQINTRLFRAKPEIFFFFGAFMVVLVPLQLLQHSNVAGTNFPCVFF